MRFDIVAGDLQTPIAGVFGAGCCTTEDGPLQNATSITFQMVQCDGSKVVVGTGDIIDSSNANYQWQDGDTDIPGVYRAQWTAEYPGGPETFPSDEDLYVIIRPKVAEPTLSSDQRVPRLITFPITYTTNNLATGYTLYTPRAGDVLIDAWIEVQQAWNGTTPIGDLGIFVTPTGGWYRALALAGVDMTVQQTAGVEGLYSDLLTLAQLATNPAIEDIDGGSFTSDPPANVGLPRFPSPFATLDPIKMVVSTDGTPTGVNPTATQGQAVAKLLIANPFYP